MLMVGDVFVLWLVPIILSSIFLVFVFVYPILSSKGVPSESEEGETGLADVPANILEKIHNGEPLTEEESKVFEKSFAKLRSQGSEYKRSSETKDEVINNLKGEVEQRKASPAVPPAAGKIEGKKVLSVDGKLLGIAKGWTYSEPEGFVGISIRPNEAITSSKVVGFNLRARDISGLVTHSGKVSSSDVITVKLDAALNPSDLMTSSEIARMKEELVDKDRELSIRRAETSSLNREVSRWRNASISSFLSAPDGHSSGDGGMSDFERGFRGSPMSSSDIDARQAAVTAARQVNAERDRSRVLGDMYNNAKNELGFWRELGKSKFPEKLKRVFQSDPEIVADSLSEYVRSFSDVYRNLPDDARDLFLQMMAGNIESMQSRADKEAVARAAEALTGAPVASASGGESEESEEGGEVAGA